MPINYQVKMGDCISSIAYEHGFSSETIWNHPLNADLKKLRRDQNVLLPGDVVVIPDLRPKVENGQTNEVHKFRLKNTPEKIRVQFNLNNNPRANEIYELEIDGKRATGEHKTDSRGYVEFSILPNAAEVKIIFNEGKEVYKMLAGYLNPIEEISGVQARLKNLGYYSGDTDNRLSEKLKEALVSFQKAQNLNSQEGDLTEETRIKLKEIYGG